MSARQRIGFVTWWAIGFTVVWAPLLVIAWTPNRDPAFWPALTALAAMGVVIGFGWYRQAPTTRWDLRRRMRASLPLVVASGYPLTCAVALLGYTVHRAPNGSVDPPSLAAWASVACLLAAAPWIVTWRARHADTWLLGLAVFWAVAAAMLIGSYGLGLLLVPLAVSHWQAAHKVPLRPAV